MPTARDATPGSSESDRPQDQDPADQPGMFPADPLPQPPVTQAWDPLTMPSLKSLAHSPTAFPRFETIFTECFPALLDEGYLFAGAQDLLPGQLAISWEAEGSIYKLILGFAAGVDHNAFVNQHLLMVYSADVVHWAALVRGGRRMTLASHLRDCVETRVAANINNTGDLM
ncbi:hypothetical protein NW755_012627 [Fusarium falciforme]|uniref:Uncharacterized protein n=1 Tax=Fusarium falciforme TaxID=195108 RepID=A0A9W8QWY3_9HYPO|nr:hypothetical protein NW755_012627 [Fusarium falciforme]